MPMFVDKIIILSHRSLVFRDVVETNSAYKISRRHQQLASQGTVYDMDIDPTMEVVITVGQVNGVLIAIQE